jgi:hypothetical protein
MKTYWIRYINPSQVEVGIATTSDAAVAYLNEDFHRIKQTWAFHIMKRRGFIELDEFEVKTSTKD